VLNTRTSRTRISRPTRPFSLVGALAGLACLSASAHASLLDANCNVPNPALSCRLTSALHVLTVVAAFLAIVLLGVIALAIRIYRQNSAENGEKRP
jgi:hypothetical protein